MLSSNEYFDGTVKSIGFDSEKGPCTAGVMDIGDYKFTTDCIELMQVTSGEMLVELPGTDEMTAFRAGDSFTIAANKTFKLKIEAACSYLCWYERD